MSTDHKPRRWVKTFKPEFASLIRNGLKCRTIRPTPKEARPQVGDIIDCRMWTGLPYRSKMQKLREGRISACTQVVIVRSLVNVGGYYVRDLDAFARQDGFDDWAAMRAWFEREHGFPFVGLLIQWEVLL